MRSFGDGHIGGRDMTLLPRFWRFRFTGTASSDGPDLRGEIISRRTRIVLLTSPSFCTTVSETVYITGGCC
jgi:hypothetical protein